MTVPRRGDPEFDWTGYPSFFTAPSAARKPILECVPSQKGLFVDAPQRHSATACFPLMSTLLPSASAISNWLRSPLSTYGPVFLIRILIAIQFPPRKFYVEQSIMFLKSRAQRGNPIAMRVSNWHSFERSDLFQIAV